MILIGQYDSPFVRRVGIALQLYGLIFTHRPWSTFSDADLIRPFNPLTRVPTLVLDDGTVLTESFCILDYLDGLVPEHRRLCPSSQPGRHRVLRLAALATGLADKAVSLFYEGRLHASVSELWVERCRTQIGDVLHALEAERAGAASDYLFGHQPTHADIALACALRFVRDVHGRAIDLAIFPALNAHAQRLEALPAFIEIQQPFNAPA